MSQNDRESPIIRFFSKITTVKAVLIISLLGLLLYANALFNGFVWDDLQFILQNPIVHDFNLPQLFGRNLFNSVGYYRPIPASYFALLYTIFGPTAFFFHLSQILLHIFNTILLFLLFRFLLGKTEDLSIHTSVNKHKNISKNQKQEIGPLYTQADWLSLLLSVVFLTHPINVESVAYIAASQSELFFLFGMLALLWSTRQKLAWKDYIAILGFSLLSLLTKETGALFVVMIMGTQYLFHKDRIFKFLLLELVVVMLYCSIRFLYAGVYFAKFISTLPAPIITLSFSERLVNIPKIFFYYIATLSFPINLIVDQRWIVTQLTVQDFYIPLFVDLFFLIAMLFGGVFIYRYKKTSFGMYLFFTLWFFFGIGMLLQIYPLDMTVSDRWFYFPLVGVLGMVGILIKSFISSLNVTNASSKHSYTKILIALFIVIILLFSARTFERNTNFHDKITLYKHDSQLQENAAIETDLGMYYAQARDLDAAFPHFQKAVVLSPIPLNLFYLAYYYETKGNLQKAVEYYFKAADAVDSYVAKYHTLNNVRSSQNKGIYTHLSKIFLYFGEYESAKKISTRGLKYFPNSFVLWVELAASENELKHQQEALSAIQTANLYDPSDLVQNIHSFIEKKQEIPFFLVNVYISQHSPPSLW